MSEHHERHQFKLLTIWVLVVACLVVNDSRSQVVVVDDEQVGNASAPHILVHEATRREVSTHPHLVLAQLPTGLGLERIERAREIGHHQIGRRFRRARGDLEDVLDWSRRARDAGLDSIWIHDSYFERDAVTFATTVAAGIARDGGDDAFRVALDDADLREEEVEYVVGTGYGRYKVTFGNTQVTEISCHGRGAVHMFPGTRTVLDMGGQDTKAIRVSGGGEILDFCMNDKCAAGTGRFLGAASSALDIPLDDLGPTALGVSAR